MREKYIPTLFVAVTFSLAGFAQTRSNTFEKEVVQAMKDYCAAVQAKDADKATSFFRNAPDFFVSLNGTRSTYNEFVPHIREELPTVKSVQLYFDTLYVRKLGPNYALASGPFHERIVDKDGKEEADDVDLTWVLIKETNRYKLAYATVMYQPMNK